MARLLALLEGGALFIAVSAMTFLTLRPVILDWRDVAALLGQASVLSTCCIVAFYYNDLYDLRIVRSFGAFVPRLLQAFGVAFILLAAFYALFPETRVAEGPFYSTLVILVCLLLPLRALTYGLMRSGPFVERVLVLGTGQMAQRLVQEIIAQPQFRYAVVGVVDDRPSAEVAGWPCPLLGPLERLGKIIEEIKPHRILVALSERRGRLPVRDLFDARVRGIHVEDAVDVYERLTGKLPIESVVPSHLIFSDGFRKSPLDLALARVMSLVASAIGLVVCLPLLALVALVVKLDSPGPIFFRQARVGMGGRRFTLFKFRTMHPTTSETSLWVKDNSERITRAGKWLRKFRLDELPQFVNILRGDMNLVGPRPHPVSSFELLAERAPFYSLRAVVRPGVTGWSQVRFGYANTLEEEIEKVCYDLFYIKHLSIWLDLRILVDTVKIVLFGRGATATDARPLDAPAAAHGERDAAVSTRATTR
jgi:exopolysaccharide biosynthesis polyprenyl glycosylphosphotransferase